MNKIVFANQLRGLAAILVVISHWFGVFWGMRDVVAKATSSPLTEGAHPFVYDLVSINPEFGLGPLGVSLFFLISGFVIPISFSNRNAIQFLLNRFFRIFPTYWIALLLGLMFVQLSAYFWGRTVSWSFITLVSNFFLVNNLFLIESLDLVSWTLAVEIKFYLLMALFIRPIQQGRVFLVFGLSFFMLLCNLFLHALTLHGVGGVKYVFSFISDFVYIQFMLIGVFFYFAHVKVIKERSMYGLILLQLCFFLLTWRYSYLENQFPIVPKIYIFGLLMFFLAYKLRDYFKSQVFLNWLADISFPLYLLHSLVGYIVIKMLMFKGLSFYFSMALAAVLSFTLAYVLHLVVEMPSSRLGKKLACLFK